MLIITFIRNLYLLKKSFCCFRLTKESKVVGNFYSLIAAIYLKLTIENVLIALQLCDFPLIVRIRCRLHPTSQQLPML